MLLDDEEWDLVRCLVTDHLTDTPDPYRTLERYFPGEVADWPFSQDPARDAATVVESAQMAALSDPHPLSIRLLQALLSIPAIKVSIQQPQVKGFLNRLLSAKELLDAIDPFRVLILPGTGESFIDRAQTRALLALLAEPDPAKPEPIAMRVVGAKNSGTSHTYSFILHLSASRGITSVRIMLSRSSTAEDIVRDLALYVAEPGVKPDPVTDSMKRLRYWAQWIVRQAARCNPRRRWWFVFDQCDELDPNSDAVELIAQLAVAIREMTGPGLERPRLVLLGYDDRFADLQLPRRQVYKDTVKPVGEAEVRDFFGCVFRDIDRTRRPGVAPDDERIAKLVEVAVRRAVEDAEKAAAAGTPYMQALGFAVEEAVNEYGSLS
jgi:hypothetical protein